MIWSFMVVPFHGCTFSWLYLGLMQRIERIMHKKGSFRILHTHLPDFVDKNTSSAGLRTLSCDLLRTERLLGH